MRVLKEQLKPEDWLALRGEVVVKLLDGSLTNASEETARGISGTLSTNWATVKKNNKGLVDELFTKEEQGLISSLANVTGRIANRTQNRSNSGAAIGGLLSRLFTSLGGTVPVQAILPVVSLALAPSIRSGRAAMAKQGAMTTPTPKRIVIGGASSVAADPEAKETLEETIEAVPVLDDFSSIVAPPQARVKTAPPPVPARGVAGLTKRAGTEAPPPQAVAQGPTESRELMNRLFPMDMV